MAALSIAAQFDSMRHTLTATPLGSIQHQRTNLPRPGARASRRAPEPARRTCAHLTHAPAAATPRPARGPVVSAASRTVFLAGTHVGCPSFPGLMSTCLPAPWERYSLDVPKHVAGRTLSTPSRLTPGLGRTRVRLHGSGPTTHPSPCNCAACQAAGDRVCAAPASLHGPRCQVDSSLTGCIARSLAAAGLPLSWVV